MEEGEIEEFQDDLGNGKDGDFLIPRTHSYPPTPPHHPNKKQRMNPPHNYKNNINNNRPSSTRRNSFLWPDWINEEAILNSFSAEEPIVAFSFQAERIEFEKNHLNDISTDPSQMRKEKALYCADGWKRSQVIPTNDPKNGIDKGAPPRIPFTHWRFSTSDEPPRDPRIH